MDTVHRILQVLKPHKKTPNLYKTKEAAALSQMPWTSDRQAVISFFVTFSKWQHSTKVAVQWVCFSSNLLPLSLTATVSLERKCHLHYLGGFKTQTQLVWSLAGTTLSFFTLCKWSLWHGSSPLHVILMPSKLAFVFYSDKKTTFKSPTPCSLAESQRFFNVAAPIQQRESQCGRGWAGNTSVCWLVNRRWWAAEEVSIPVQWCSTNTLKAIFFWFTQKISQGQICGKEPRILRLCTWRTHGCQSNSSFFTIGATLLTENESVSSLSLSEDVCHRQALLWADISLLLLAVGTFWIWI